MGKINYTLLVRRSSLAMMIFAIALSFGAPMTPAASQVGDQSYNRDFNQGKTETLDQEKTLAYPAELPVFKLTPPPVGNESVQAMLRVFDGISSSGVITDTAHTGTVRFRGVDTTSGAVLDQFQASGGIYAYNITQAFMETPANLDYGPNQICDYMSANGLFPQEITPEATNCLGSPPYTNELIYMNTLAVAGAPGASEQPIKAVSNSLEVIGQIWHIPLAINVASDARQPVFIPLAGPGGHLSLLLTGYDERPPIDSDLPGLQAIAMPWHGRQRQVIGLYKVISPQVAAQQLVLQNLSITPTAVITPGTPELVYYADDPAVEQKSLAPTWIFPDATALVDGQVVNLKVSAFPGVEGFYPSVDILDPLDGAPYYPGSSLSVLAEISGGAGPYTYTLSLEDGTSLTTGVASSGAVNLQASALPVHPKPEEADIRLIMDIVDTNGAPAQDQVTLVTPTPQAYLPLLQHNTAGSAAGYPLSPQSLAATRKMGVEWIKYYNGTNNDLPGVPADGNGFYSKMQSLGWSGTFKWTNNSAWEKDWRDCSLGGLDCTYGVERAEFAYFSGHGGPARIYFGGYKDSLDFFGGNARFQKLRWASFSSCQTLRAGPFVGAGNPPLTHWFPAFQGAYMLLGFHSNMADIAFGAPFVDAMNGIVTSVFPISIPKPAIREAWVMMAFMLNAGKPAYLYARSNSFDPSNLKLPTSASTLPALTNLVEYRWVWWD